MNKEIVNSILAKLDVLAVKLGMTVEQIWPWLIRQQYIDAFWALGLFVSFFLPGYLAYRFIRKVKWCDNMTQEQGIGVIVGIISAISVIYLFVNLICEFPDIFNPEYWALKDLIRMIR